MLTEACRRKASDLILTVGQPPQLKLNGRLVSFVSEKLTPDYLVSLMDAFLTDDQQKQLAGSSSVDFSRGYPGLSRFRFHIFRQRGALALVARVIPHDIPRLESLGLPVEIMQRFALQPSGLLLFTGPTGSGKSTTMASIIQYMNETRSAHVICLEDPIEFLHQHQCCTIEQREVVTDTPSFMEALRDVFREAPDVVMVGEMRDWETMALTLKLAETGHLVMATLHTADACQAISRIVHAFPSDHQQQVYLQLSMVLHGVVAQQLVPLADGSGRVMCHEILLATPAVRNMIREQQQHQLYTAVQTGREDGMNTMNDMLVQLVRSGRVTVTDAHSRSPRSEELKRLLEKI